MKSTKEESPAVLCSDSPVPLKSILCTEEMNQRPARPPDYETENRALSVLVQSLADSPGTILQKLADTILEVFQSHSAGLSLVTKDEKNFYWPAIAGAWKQHVGGGTPRDFGPCGDVLDCNTPLLFRHFERRYPYLLEATPVAKEALLIPFYVQGKAVGTIWAMAHDDCRKFDAEDLRQLESLGRFASAAYQAVEVEEVQNSRSAALNLMEDAVHARQTAEKLNEDLRQSEETLRRLNEDLKHFAYAASHDLQEPLRMVISYTQLLARQFKGKLDGQADQFITCTIEGAQRMETLLKGMRDYWLVNERTGEQSVRVDCNRVFEAACGNLDLQIQESGAIVTHDPLPTVTAEEMPLELLFQNLIGNAVKYRRQSEPPRIHVSAQKSDHAWKFSVTDKGIGIEAEHLKTVFAPFKRLHGAEYPGTGIGLAICQKIVEGNEGRIWVESTYGQGSVFHFTIPDKDGDI